MRPHQDLMQSYRLLVSTKIKTRALKPSLGLGSFLLLIWQVLNEHQRLIIEELE
jgi:hypothetical protein